MVTNFIVKIASNSCFCQIFCRNSPIISLPPIEFSNNKLTNAFIEGFIESNGSLLILFIFFHVLTQGVTLVPRTLTPLIFENLFKQFIEAYLEHYRAIFTTVEKKMVLGGFSKVEIPTWIIKTYT